MEHARDCFASSWQLLKRNQELRKVLLAYGLQRATASLPDIFVLSVLRTKYWGYNMAAYASIMAIGINFVAILLGGPSERSATAWTGDSPQEWWLLQALLLAGSCWFSASPREACGSAPGLRSSALSETRAM